MVITIHHGEMSLCIVVDYIIFGVKMIRIIALFFSLFEDMIYVETFLHVFEGKNMFAWLWMLCITFIKGSSNFVEWQYLITKIRMQSPQEKKKSSQEKKNLRTQWSWKSNFHVCVYIYIYASICMIIHYWFLPIRLHVLKFINKMSWYRDFIMIRLSLHSLLKYHFDELFNMYI